MSYCCLQGIAKHRGCKQNLHSLEISAWVDLHPVEICKHFGSPLRKIVGWNVVQHTY